MANVFVPFARTLPFITVLDQNNPRPAKQSRNKIIGLNFDSRKHEPKHHIATKLLPSTAQHSTVLLLFLSKTKRVAAWWIYGWIRCVGFLSLGHPPSRSVADTLCRPRKEASTFHGRVQRGIPNPRPWVGETGSLVAALRSESHRSSMAEDSGSGGNLETRSGSVSSRKVPLQPLWLAAFSRISRQSSAR